MQFLSRSLWSPKTLPRYGQCQASNLTCRKAHPLIIRSTRLTARRSPTPSTRRQWTLSPILLPPLVFAGLLVTLWTYKCLMLVVFQNKIIYMPSVPPFSRSEKIDDYAAQCLPVIWQEVRTKAADGTEIALAIGEIDATQQPPVLETSHAAATKNRQRHIIVVYFHGNGGSIPPRLPGLSSVLKLLQSSTPTSPRYTVVALSYRGFWTSRGRPSERGISLDASAALRYVNEHLASDPSGKTSIVLWGQSIGAGVATSAAAAANCSSSSSAFVKDAAVTSKSIPIRGLLLETPFTSVKAMLLAIYPQKWLPYRYLYPFLRNDWNSKSALRKIANASCSAPNILILQAGSDELVPPTHGIELESVASELNIDTKRIEVYGALHHEAAMKRRGREEIVDFLKGIK